MQRDLLEVLKAELEFLNSGGYTRVPGASWRPAFIFEDSPACMNRDYQVNPGSCADCLLMPLVPPEFRSSKFPCRHIPLNAAGETLDSLYRYGDQTEIEEAARKWLQAMIAQLEEQRQEPSGDHCKRDSPSAENFLKGTAIHDSLHAKCANPACPVQFDWHAGKFFRFRESPSQAAQHTMDTAPAGVHGVRHFWLCERCSHIFTLVCDEKQGVVLELLLGALPTEDLSKSTAA